MKVQNMTSSNGNKVANQFIITTEEEMDSLNPELMVDVEYFQSYGSIIVRKEYGPKHNITLDSLYWNYSTTTSKYRNMFLGETTKETKAKIKSGEYKLANLN